MRKKTIFVWIICGLVIFSLASTAEAKQPPLPPEIELLVSEEGVNEEFLNKFISDSARCGIRINPVYKPFLEIALEHIYTGDYEMVMFIGILGTYTGFETIISSLEWLFVIEEEFGYIFEPNLAKYDNPALIDKIKELRILYDNNEMEAAIELFHEIERILYEEQPVGAIAFDETDMPEQYNLRIVMMNSVDSPLADKAIRKALSYLIDREMYNELLGHSYAVSHMYEWTEFHDSSLPLIPYSIGKATSTLTKGGYRPQALH